MGQRSFRSLAAGLYGHLYLITTMLTENLDLFFDDFATNHTIDRVVVEMIVGERLTAPSMVDGTWEESMEIIVRTADYAAPARNQAISFNGERYVVSVVSVDGVLATFTISRPVA